MLMVTLSILINVLIWHYLDDIKEEPYGYAMLPKRKGTHESTSRMLSSGIVQYFPLLL